MFCLGRLIPKVRLFIEIRPRTLRKKSPILVRNEKGKTIQLYVQKVKSSRVRESKAVLDSGFHAVDSGFKVMDSRLLVKLGFWNPICSRIRDSLCCIPDSKS